MILRYLLWFHWIIQWIFQGNKSIDIPIKRVVGIELVMYINNSH